jgi:hypothetical protein
VVASERLPVDVEELIPRSHDHRGAQLGRPAASVVLSVSRGKRSCTGEKGIGPDQRYCSEAVRLDDVGCFTLLVEKYGKGHHLIFDKRLGVPPATRTDGRDTRAGCFEVFVSIADLTGPFSTGQSAEMPQKQKNMWFLGPKISKAVRRALRIGQGKICEFGNGRSQ